MKKSIVFLGLAAGTLAACVSPENSNSGPSSRNLSELPENVRAIAAPGQDLNNVRINPADGCFLYRHVGPVETTYLPLTNRRGQPICAKREETPAKA